MGCCAGRPERCWHGCWRGRRGGLSFRPGGRLSTGYFRLFCLRLLRLLRGRAIFVDGEKQVSHFYLVAFLDMEFLDDAGNRGGDFDGGFLGFEFQERLIFGNGVADGNEDFGQIARIDVFSQLGELDRSGHGLCP